MVEPLGRANSGAIEAQYEFALVILPENAKQEAHAARAHGIRGVLRMPAIGPCCGLPMCVSCIFDSEANLWQGSEALLPLARAMFSRT